MSKMRMVMMAMLDEEGRRELKKAASLREGLYGTNALLCPSCDMLIRHADFYYSGHEPWCKLLSKLMKSYKRAYFNAGEALAGANGLTLIGKTFGTCSRHGCERFAIGMLEEYVFSPQMFCETHYSEILDSVHRVKPQKREADENSESDKSTPAAFMAPIRGATYYKRMEALEAYGAVCKCCGETRNRFLTFDHVGGWGKEHRKEIGPNKLYSWLKKNNYPPTIQVLCMNCNWSQRRGDKCPHEEERIAQRNP